MTADEQILDSEVHLNETAKWKSSMLKKITSKMGVIQRVNGCNNRNVKKITSKMRVIQRVNMKLCKRRRFMNKFGSPSGFEPEDRDFPEWFLTEVFARLPVKLVFRCKCVSKHWLSVISDPSFSHYYLSRASTSLSIARCPWTFVPMGMLVDNPKLPIFTHYKPLEDIYSANLIFPDTCVLPLPNSQQAKIESMGDRYHIIAADNGFVLYGWHHYRGPLVNYFGEYYICNPLTKQWFALPASKYASRQVGAGFITQVEGGILTSYKVVLLYCPSGGGNLMEFEIFSSETGEWKEFSLYSKIAFRASCLCKALVVLNNKLHWEDRGLGIIAYDPYNSPDKYRIIKLPAERSKSEIDPLCSMFCAHQGRLKFFQLIPILQQRGYTGFKIWAQEDYSSDHWYLEHAIRDEDIILDDRLCVYDDKQIINKFVSFHPYDADIVYLNWACDNLVSYNIKTRRVEVVGDFQKHEEKNPNTSWGRWPHFLLQLPPWPICLPPSLIYERRS